MESSSDHNGDAVERRLINWQVSAKTSHVIVVIQYVEPAGWLGSPEKAAGGNIPTLKLELEPSWRNKKAYF